ncbi:MAG: peptidyl-prolyl cis-trans isomerase [Deltaproteobacteria bacterium]|nr:peptidyl-prolyl cis-trans isomerase [Deltaproteobacteria bacterium]
MSRLFFLPILLALFACGPGQTDPGGVSGSSESHEPYEAALEEPDWSETVARVNGEPITRRLLASQVAMAAADRPPYDEHGEGFENRGGKERAAALEAEQLRDLIVLELACQEALRLGYAPSEEELDQALALYKKDFDEPDLIYQVLDHYGSTEEDLKKQLQKNMALKKWQANDFLSEIKVDEEEARAFYQANLEQLRHDEMLRLSQIMVGVSLLAPPAAKDQARAKAEAALRRLAAGEDFGTVAAEVNVDPENRGDLGWLVQGQSLPAIEAEVWKLPVGGRTGLLETILGFHIVKVTGRRPPGVESFESLRPELVEFIAARKLEEVLDRKIRDLINSADIEILDAALQAARPPAGP